MAIIRYPGLFDLPNPMRELTRVRREMDRLLSDLVGGGGATMGSGVFPPLNVGEDAENVYVCAEVPGVKPEDMDVSVHGNTLTLRGERKPEALENVNYHRRERTAGTFHKAVTLPAEINADGVRADCRDGVLKLTLPKAEHAKPRRISVKAD